MTAWTVHNREELLAALEKAAPGDLIQAEALADLARSSRDLLPLLDRMREQELDFSVAAQGVDTRGEGGRLIYALVRGLADLDRSRRRKKQLEGIARAREEGRYRGRKPIAVDETLFDSVVALWREGRITAREAMSRLDLKPNTFYRRIKEQEEMKMKDYKQIEKDIRAELKEAARQGRQDLHELKKQVRAEAEEVKQAASETLELHDVEKEIRRDRRKAEAEHQDTIRQMKKDVESEAKELKKLMEES